MWYEDDMGGFTASDYYGCKDCEDKEDLMDRCRRLTYDIVLSMNGRKVPNIYGVEDLVEELCDCLGVKNPPPVEDRVEESVNAR